MTNASIQTLKFSINAWTHLYSLQQAILHNLQHTGRTLTIKGKILGSDFLQQQDTAIDIHFLQTNEPPNYPALDNQLFTLGVIKQTAHGLQTDISVDRQIFEELRKNLLEYADIEGIHIVVTLGLLSSNAAWNDGQPLKIVQLDYAMKGDA